MACCLYYDAYTPKSYGTGYTTELRGMHRHLEPMCCVTLPALLGSDN